MTEDPCLDPYLDALREDLPTAADEARMQRRLLSAGIGVSLVLASKTAVAKSAALLKAGLFAELSARFVSLPLLAQLGVVTAATTVVATGPVLVVMHHSGSRQSEPAMRQLHESTRPSAVASKRTVDTGETRATPTATATLPLAEPTAAFLVGAAQIPTRSEATRAPVEVSTPASSLAEETRLIDDALAAIRRSDLMSAERLLERHDTLYPNARLGRERQRAKEKLAEARRKLEP